MIDIEYTINEDDSSYYILLKTDSSYNEEISLRNIIFNTSIQNSNFYNIVFEERNPVTKEKLSKFLTELEKLNSNIEFESCLDAIPIKESTNSEYFIQSLLKNIHDETIANADAPIYINDTNNLINGIGLYISSKRDSSVLEIYIVSNASEIIEYNFDEFARENAYFINFDNIKY